MLTLIVFSSNACWIGVIAVARLAGKGLIFSYAKPAFNFSVTTCSELASSDCFSYRCSFVVVQSLYAPVNIVFMNRPGFLGDLTF